MCFGSLRSPGAASFLYKGALVPSRGYSPRGQANLLPRVSRGPGPFPAGNVAYPRCGLRLSYLLPLAFSLVVTSSRRGSVRQSPNGFVGLLVFGKFLPVSGLARTVGSIPRPRNSVVFLLIVPVLTGSYFDLSATLSVGPTPQNACLLLASLRWPSSLREFLRCGDL